MKRIGALLAFTLLVGCEDEASFRLPLPGALRIAELSADRQALLRAEIEIPGLLGETELLFDDAHTNLSGAFVVEVTEDVTVPVIVRVLGRLSATSQEVVLGVARKDVLFTPRARVLLELVDSDWAVAGSALFDLNGNGASNIDDLVNGFDPAPPVRVLDVSPGDVQFPSGVRPGEFTRQVIVVENVSGLPQQLTPRVVGGQGVSLARIDAAGAAEGGARRELPPFTLQPFQEVLFAVTFAPTNAFLVRGNVALSSLHAPSAVRAVSEVPLIANADGDPQPVPAGYAPALLDGANIGIGGPVIAYPPEHLFAGQEVSPGVIALSDDEGDTVEIAPLDFATEAVGGLPASAVFLVELPPRHRLSAVLSALEEDADLGLFVLDENDNLSDPASPGAVELSKNPGVSPEVVQLRNFSSTASLRAVLVLSRVDTRDVGDVTSAKPLPFSLLAQLTAGPEFADDEPISETRGDFRGGGEVVLRGIAFEQGATVRVGTHLADRARTVVEDDGATIRFILPAADVDDIDQALTVVATNPNGEAATLPAVFTYDAPAPEIDDVDPPTGSTLGGTPLVISGAFFSDDNGGPLVTIGGAPATDVVLDGTTLITCRAPAGTAGFELLVVENIDDDGLPVPSAGFPFVFVEPEAGPPVVDAVEPSSGFVNDPNPELVLISGSGFINGVSVRFGSRSADVVSVDATAIVVRPPLVVAGEVVDVLVTNPDGQSAILADGYTYLTPAPALVDVNPNVATTLGGTRMFANGNDFLAGAVAIFEQGALSITAVDTTFVSRTQLNVTSPVGLAAGAATLTIINPDGQRSNGLEVTLFEPAAPPPRILQLNPSSIAVDAIGNARTITVVGQNFQPGLTFFVDDAQVPAANVTATAFTFVAPARAPGAAIVRVTNPDGQNDADALIYVEAADPIFRTIDPDLVGALLPGDEVVATGANLPTIGGANTLHIRDGADNAYAFTLLEATASLVRVRILDTLPERSDFRIALDNGNVEVAASPTFGAVEPRVLSVQAVNGAPVDGGAFAVLLQGASLNSARIGTVRFSLAGEGDVDLVPSFRTDSLVRVDVVGELAQGAWTASIVWPFVDENGVGRELVVAAPGNLFVAGDCGNGFVDVGEECDSNDVDGQLCTDFGFAGGELRCNNVTCRLITTLCTDCGNGLIESQNGEQCDGANLNGATCADLVPGATGGTPTCTSTCTLSATGCSVCGNGIVEGDEQCDGNNLNLESCGTLGFNFDVGTLRCSDSCAFDTALCGDCGDNRCDEGENNQNCAADCPATCGNNVCDGAEQCTTCPRDCSCAPPFSIVDAGGDAQTNRLLADLAEPLRVRVQDNAGQPLVGVQITFQAPPGGRVFPAQVLTDVNGAAATAATLPRTIGPAVFTATGTGPDAGLLSGAPLVFDADVQALAPGIVTTILNQPSVAGATTVPTNAAKLAVNLDSFAGIAVRESDGAIFVADSFNHRVVRIDANGTGQVVAGDGQGGNGPDFVVATQSRLNFPRGVAVDAAGDLYIADTNNDRIKRVDADTGIISTFAGGGAGGQPNDGDGNVAGNAFIDAPTSVVVTPAFEVFVLQDFGDRIRKIDTQGIISSPVVPRACSAANGVQVVSVNASQMTLDARGRLVFIGTVQDAGGCPLNAGNFFEHVLRLEANGSITHIAGGPNGSGDGVPARGATLNLPVGVAVDAGGNVYVSERGNGTTSGHRVRKISNTGVITTLAGQNGVTGNSGDGGAASAARFSDPAGLAFDTQGNLLVLDGGNENVRAIGQVFSTTEPVINVAVRGNGQSAFINRGLTQPIGVQITDGDGAGVPGVAVTVTPSAGAAVEPAGTLTTDASGLATTLAFVGRAPGPYTFRVDVIGLDALPVSGSPFTITATAQDVAPGTIVPIVNGFASGGSALSTTAVRTRMAVSASVGGIAVDPDDNSLYVSDTANHRVLKVQASGAISVFAGITGSAGFGGDGGQATAALLSAPRGIAIDSQKNVYISDSNNDRVRRVAPNGVITTFAGNGSPGSAPFGDTGPAIAANLDFPTALLVDPVDDALIIMDEFHNRVRRVAPDTTIDSLVIGNQNCVNGSARLSSLTDSAISQDLAGRIYFTGRLGGGTCPAGTNVFRDYIFRIEANGAITPLVGGGALALAGFGLNVDLGEPSGLATDPFGNVFVVENNLHRLKRTNILGQVTTIAGDGTAGFAGDYGPASGARIAFASALTFDPAGNLYFWDGNNAEVRMIRAVAAAAADTASLEIAAGTPQSVNIVQQTPTPLRVRITDGLGAAVTGLPVAFASAELGVRVLSPSVSTNIAGEATTSVRVGRAAQDYVITATARTWLEPIDVPGSPALFTLSGVRPPSGTSLALFNRDGVAGSFAVPQPAADVRGNLDWGGVALDAAGNLYLSDVFNDRVLIISPEGEAELFAGGGGTNGFAGDGNAATAATLNDPRGIAVDAVGNVWIVDTTNDRVRVVFLDGTIDTVAGGGASRGDGGDPGNAQFLTPVAIGIAPNGEVFIHDEGDSTIRVISNPLQPTEVINTAVSNQSCSGGALRGASVVGDSGLAFDAAGRLLFSGFITNATGCPAGIATFTDLILARNGDGTFTHIAGGSGTTANTGDGLAGTGARLNNVAGLTVNPVNGDVFFVERNQHRLRVVAGGTSAGAITTVLGTLNTAGFSSFSPPGTALLNFPEALLRDPATGDIYWSEGGSESVRLLIP